jgi:hypothetical protein
LGYSSRFWYQHAISVVHKDKYRQLQILIDRLFSPEYSTGYKNWLWTHNCDGPYSSLREREYPQPLYYAALLGFYESVRKLLREGAEVKMEGRTGNAILAATSNGHTTIVEKILETVSELTEEEFCKAINHIQTNARKLILIYLKKYKFKITEGVVKAAAKNWKSGEEIMTLLLDQKGDDIRITKEVVKAAADNWESSEEIMTLLLDQKGDVGITDDAVMEIARQFDKQMMTLLFKQKGEDIKITEEVVKAAAKNWKSGEEIINLLLN